MKVAVPSAHPPPAIVQDSEFNFRPTLTEVHARSPRSLSAHEAIEWVQRFIEHGPPKRSSSGTKSGDGGVDVPIGLDCPSCHSSNTEFALVSTTKGGLQHIWYCRNRLCQTRFGDNPCIACPVCQVSNDLLDRLWHHCDDMKLHGLPPVFLRPNIGLKIHQTCMHCGKGPAKVSCRCT